MYKVIENSERFLLQENLNLIFAWSDREELKVNLKKNIVYATFFTKVFLSKFPIYKFTSVPISSVCAFEYFEGHIQFHMKQTC